MVRHSLLAASLLATAFTLPAAAAEKTAIFAGGCFWCIEKDFEHVKGVGDVVSGYSGGATPDPSYKTHVSGGHREVVKIPYDDSVVSYAQLLAIFFRTVNPTDGGGQFCDRGHSYSTAVYALDGDQLAAAQEAKKDAAAALGKPIATEIAMAQKFHVAEDYHQNYAKRNPIRYNYYRTACGRDKAVKALWGDMAYKGVSKGS